MPTRGTKRKIQKIGQTRKKRPKKRITAGEAFAIIAEHIREQDRKRKKKKKTDDLWDENIAHEAPMFPARRLNGAQLAALGVDVNLKGPQI